MYIIVSISTVQYCKYLNEKLEDGFIPYKVIFCSIRLSVLWSNNVFTKCPLKKGF